MTAAFPPTWSHRLRIAARENRTGALKEPISVGSFTAHALLDPGGQGWVYLATGDSQGRSEPVVLKIYRDSSADFIRRLDRSLELQRQVNEHPRLRGTAEGLLPGLVAFDLDSEFPWAVHRYRGVNLSTWKLQGQLFSDALIAQLLTSVQTLHRCGVTHRDLKPANILADMSSRFGGPKIVLCDLDLARSSDLTTLTQTGAVLGTRMYSAPEQLMGARVDVPADVYSVAATLVFLATGRHPPDAVQNLMELRRSPVLHPDVEEALGAKSPWVVKALSFDPDERPELEDLYSSLLPDSRRGVRGNFAIEHRNRRKDP